MPDAVNILYVCTGNACRSQMAEGWTRSMGGNRVKARSAGIEAHGKNPHAIAVMRESGVDISTQRSTVIDNGMLDWADLVVTVCGHADEMCPALPPGVKKLHWPIPDPARAKGSEEEILSKFRDTRDEVKQRVAGLLEGLGNGGTP